MERIMSDGMAVFVRWDRRGLSEEVIPAKS